MQALIVAISLYLFSSINSSEIQIENIITSEENHIEQFNEVKFCTSVELLEDPDS